MAIRVYKPTTPARRKTSVLDTSDLTKKRPEKSLTRVQKKSSGRNNQGRITVRHRGGGEKRLYRMVDFKQVDFDAPAEVIAIEYDPNRTANIALLKYKDNHKSYILAPAGLQIGDEIVCSKNKAEIAPGNRLPLEKIPSGSSVHNVEMQPGRGGQLGRSAGAKVVLSGCEGKYAQLKMPSGEIRLVLKDCMASIGEIGNSDWQNIRWGKAGRMRHRGIRPTVRGKAMNPVDHPHGGGEGSQPIGLKHPKTPWGKPALGHTTRKKKKQSSKLIIKSRKKKRRR